MMLFSVSAVLVALPQSIAEFEDVSGTYLCTAEQEAKIASIHTMEGGSPTASVSDLSPYRFRMRISPSRNPSSAFVMNELEYEGEDRNPITWHTANSVLHGPYAGDGAHFVALTDQAFFNLSFARGGKIRSGSNGRKPSSPFYQSGFAYPGGEDTQLLIRYGWCEKER